MKELKILTLNIWRYFDWEKRKDLVINLLKEQNADVVFLQEACYDDRLKNKYENQVDEVNRKLKYPYFVFTKEADMKKLLNSQPISWKMFYGLGILSKYKIKKSEKIALPHVESDRDFTYLHCSLETEEGNMDVINVHFENNDKGSKKHLRTVLQWSKKKKIKPVIAGDFNIIKTENLIELADKDYHISYKIKPYLSFMPTQFSYNKVPVALDYIIAHKKAFNIKSIECINSSVSDHFPVLAEIEKI